MAMKQILTILLFLFSVCPTEARNYIVCIGIADYPGTNSDLKLSSYDAVTIKTVYDRNGDATTEQLTDREATVGNAIATISKLFDAATTDDTIILFFSGHGIPGGFVCYDGLLRYDAITEIMMKSSARQKIVFADACFAGKARASDKHSGKSAETEVMFFLSSRTSEKSLEKRSWRNSLFTAYLERGLRGGADTNKDRKITAKELFGFVSKGMAESSGNKQHPVMWGKFDDNMPVMVWKERTK